MKSITALLLGTFITGLSCHAQNKIEFEEYDLGNGLHVILHEDHTSPIVTVSVMYHVGSKNEDPSRTGFAHFFEHLLFEGSDNIKRGEFAKYVENAGGILNANTSNDRTFYFENLPSNMLEMGLWLESERMMHARVDIIGVETQRDVVKEEKRLRVDNQPYGSIIGEIMKRMYKVHPYKWPTIGSMEHLNAAKEEDYIAFYKNYYVPNNAILSIAGDIDKKRTKELIKAYFAEIPKGSKAIPAVTAVEPPLGGEVRDTVYDNIQLPAVVQAYRMPANGTEDFYAVSMLAQLMSQGESSRLQKKCVNETQSAMFVGAFPFALEHPGITLSFGICANETKPETLEAEIDAEFKKVKEELISDKEFEKLKNQIESNFVSSNSSMMGIAESLADYEMYLGDANLANTEIDRFLKVTKEDIKRVANKYFVKDNRVVLYYLPKEETAE
jgi:zinc protease